MSSAHNVCRICPQWISIRAPHKWLRGKMKNYLRRKLRYRGFELSVVPNIAANVVENSGHRSGHEKIGFSCRVERISPYLCSAASKPQCQPAALKSRVT